MINNNEEKKSFLEWLRIYSKNEIKKRDNLIAINNSHISEQNKIITDFEKEIAELKYENKKLIEQIGGNIEEIDISDTTEVLLSDIAEFKDSNILEQSIEELKDNIINEFKEDIIISREITNNKVIITAKLNYLKKLNN